MKYCKTVEEVLQRYTLDKHTGCWLWTGATTSGKWNYGTLKRQGRWWPAHRFFYIHLVASIPDGKFVCHHCDTPRCVNPEHLYVGTQKDNMRDAVERNARMLGTGRVNAKLTPEIVCEIRSLWAQGATTRKVKTRKPFSARSIAEHFGVSTSTVVNVIHKYTWAWL